MPLRIASRWSALVVVALAVPVAAPAPASARTLHVAPDGVRRGPGDARRPFARISDAARVARRGDVVRVAPGRYRETVRLTHRSSGVAFVGPARGRAVVDGEGRRSHGFFSNTAQLRGVRIERFEVTGQTEAGIWVVGSHSTVVRNRVHHIGGRGTVPQTRGIHVLQGARHRVTDNLVHSIGPRGEAIAIMLSATRDALVSRNVIRLVRKEGVRDYLGLDNRISDNRISLCWTAIATNSATGTVVVNNFLADNVQGLNPKHTSEPRVLRLWRLGEGRWTRIWHNTVFRSLDSSLALAINEPRGDLVDARGNVFSGAGGAFIADQPRVRGDRIVVDHNVYSGRGGLPPFVHHVGYDFGDLGLERLEDVRARLGWEAHGQFEPAPATPAGAPERTPPSGELVRFGPPASRRIGTRRGAYGLPEDPLAWRPLTLVPVASSAPDTPEGREALQRTVDGRHHTYWQTATNRDEHATYDLGGLHSFDVIVLGVYSHGSARAVRGFRFEVSDDRQDWRTIAQGANPDPLGSDFKYELRRPATGRFLRFTLVDTFCGDGGCGEDFIFNELRVGSLVPPPPSAARPVVRTGRRAVGLAARRVASLVAGGRPLPSAA